MTKVSPGRWLRLDNRCFVDAHGVTVAYARPNVHGNEIDIPAPADERAILATPRTLELLRQLADATLMPVPAWDETYTLAQQAKELLVEIEGE